MAGTDPVRRRNVPLLETPKRLVGTDRVVHTYMPADLYTRLEHVIRLWSLHPESGLRHPLDDVRYRVQVLLPTGEIATPYVYSATLANEDWLDALLKRLAEDVYAARSGERLHFSRLPSDLVPHEVAEWSESRQGYGRWRPQHARQALRLLQEARRLGIDPAQYRHDVPELYSIDTGLFSELQVVHSERQLAMPAERVVISGRLESVPLEFLVPVAPGQAQPTQQPRSVQVSQRAKPTKVDRAYVPLHEEIHRFLSEDVGSSTLELTLDVEAWVDYLYGEHREAAEALQRLTYLQRYDLIRWEADPQAGALRLVLQDPALVRQYWRRPLRGRRLIDDPFRAVFGRQAEQVRQVLATQILPENIYDIESAIAEYYRVRAPGWVIQQPSTETFTYVNRVFGVTYASQYPTTGFERLTGTISGESSAEFIDAFSMYQQAVAEQNRMRELLYTAGGQYDPIDAAIRMADRMGLVGEARSQFLRSVAEDLLGAPEAAPLAPDPMVRRTARAHQLLDRIRAEAVKQQLYAQRTGGRTPRYWVTREGDLVAIESIDPRGILSGKSTDLPSAVFRYVTLQDLLQESGLEVEALVPELDVPEPRVTTMRTTQAGQTTFEEVADLLSRRLRELDIRPDRIADRQVLHRAAEAIRDIPLAGLSAQDMMRVLGLSVEPGYESIQSLMATLLFGVDPYRMPTLSMRQLQSIPMVQESVLQILSRIGNPHLVSQVIEDIPGTLFTAASELIAQNLPGTPGTAGGAVPATLGDYLRYLRSAVVQRVSGQSVDFLGESLAATDPTVLESTVDAMTSRILDRAGAPLPAWKEQLWRRYASSFEPGARWTLRLSSGQTIQVRIDPEQGRITLPSGKSVRFEGGTFEAPITTLAYPYPVAVTLRGAAPVAWTAVGTAAVGTQPRIEVDTTGRYRLVASAEGVYETLRGGAYRLLDVETAVGWMSPAATESERAALRALHAAGIDPSGFIHQLAILSSTGEMVYSMALRPEEVAAASPEQLLQMQAQLARDLAAHRGRVLGETIAGYNVEFDIGALLRVADLIERVEPDRAARLRRALESVTAVDVLALARARMPGAPHVALENVARLLGMDVSQAHEAAADVQLLQQVIHRLLEMGESPAEAVRSDLYLLAVGGGSVVDEASGLGVYSMRGRVFRPTGRLQRVALPDGSEQYLLTLEELVWANNRWMTGRQVSISAPSVALLNDMLSTMTVALDESKARHYSQVAMTDYYQRMIRRVLNPIAEGDELAELGQFLGGTVTAAEGVDLYTVLRYASRAQVIGSIAQRYDPSSGVGLSELVRTEVQRLVQSMRDLPEGKLPSLNVLLPRQVAAMVRRLPPDVQRQVARHLVEGLERYASQEYLYDPRLLRQYMELYRVMPDLWSLYGKPLETLLRRMVAGELQPAEAAGLWSAATSAINEQLLSIEQVRRAAVREVSPAYGAERWIRLNFPEVPVDIPFGEGLTAGHIESIWRQRLGAVFRRYAGRESPPVDYLFAIGYATAGLEGAQYQAAVEAMARYRMGLSLSPEQRAMFERLVRWGMERREQFERTMIVHEVRRAMDPQMELDFYTALALGSAVPSTYAEQMGRGEAYEQLAGQISARMGRLAGELRARAQEPGRLGFLTAEDLAALANEAPDVFVRSAPPAIDLAELMRAARGSRQAAQVVNAVTESLRTAKFAADESLVNELVSGAVLPRAQRRLRVTAARELFSRFRRFAELTATATTPQELRAAYQSVFGEAQFIQLGRRLLSLQPRHLHMSYRYLSRLMERGVDFVAREEWEAYGPEIVRAITRLQSAEMLSVSESLSVALVAGGGSGAAGAGATAAGMEEVARQVSEAVAAGADASGGAAGLRLREGFARWFREVDWGAVGRWSAGLTLAGVAAFGIGAVWAYRPRRSEPTADTGVGRPQRRLLPDGDLVRVDVSARVRDREHRERVMREVLSVRYADVEQRDNRRLAMRQKEMEALDRELAYAVEY